MALKTGFFLKVIYVYYYYYYYYYTSIGENTSIETKHNLL